MLRADMPYSSSTAGYVITFLLSINVLMMGGFGAFFWYFVNRQSDQGKLIATLDKAVTILQDHDDMIIAILQEAPILQHIRRERQQ